MERSHPHFRALAVDFDGTLTRGPVPAPEVLAEIRRLRAEGLKVMLVTGRIMSELRHSFAEVDRHFDAIVAENGAVLSTAEGDRRLCDPVPLVLEDALGRHGVPIRRGQVLLACDSAYDTVVLTEIHRLGLECQVMYNRAALMVLPSGVTKVSGAREALALFHLSPHNTLAIGDAENDLGLLAACGLGVAVANAVPSVRAQADIVTENADGDGVLEVLTGPVLGGQVCHQPERWRIDLGLTASGEVGWIPSTHVNLLILGGSNAGKSHAGGMVAEALIARGYCTLVVDFEGDHAGLGALPEVLLMGGGRALPAAEEVALLLRHRCGSMVLDLSLLAPGDQDAYVASVGAELATLRARTGLPQWIVTDEAHRPYGSDTRGLQAIGGKGHCLISWNPQGLHPQVVAGIDLVLALPSSPDHGTEAADRAEISRFIQAWWPDPVPETHPTRDAVMHRFDQARPGQALLLDRGSGRVEILTLKSRRTNHVRHWHKYAQASLPEEKRFGFRTPDGAETGQRAANLYEFHHILRQIDAEVVLHHCRHRDFSRWARAVLADVVLSQRFAEIEREADASRAGDLLRERLLVEIERRYLTG